MNLAEIALRPGREPALADIARLPDHPGAGQQCGISGRVFSAWCRSPAGTGVKPGDKILLRMTNSAEFAAAFLAVRLAWRDTGAAEFAVRP